MVKLHQAYILASEGLAVQVKHFQTENAPNVVWRPGSARTRWEAYRPPDPLAALKLWVLHSRRLRRLASRLRHSETERSGSSFSHSNTETEC